MGMKPPITSRTILKGLQLVGGLAVVSVLSLTAWLLWIHEDWGEPNFRFEESLTIARSTPDGINYTVNNSLATFSLDVARRDRHGRKIFACHILSLLYF
jgi:hypothetical protein